MGFIVAVDGVAGSGKGSITKIIAEIPTVSNILTTKDASDSTTI